MMRINIGNLKGDKSTVGRLLTTRTSRKFKNVTLSNSSPVQMKSIYLYSTDNPVIKALMRGEDVIDKLTNSDEEIEFEFAGKAVKRADRILLDSHDDFVYSYESIEKIEGIIPRNFKLAWSGKILEKNDGFFIVKTNESFTLTEQITETFYYEHFQVGDFVYCFKIKNLMIISENEQTYYTERTFRYQEPNVNVEKKPLRVTEKTIGLLEFIERYVVKRTYQLVHVDNLAFDFFYEIAENLSKIQKMASIQFYDEIKKKWNDNIVFKRGEKGYKAFLEGRVEPGTRGYALLIHLSEMELKPITVIPKEVSA